MISIDGLTRHQVQLLDTMWALDSIEDYDQWYTGLDEDTMNMVDTLEQMVILAELDNVDDVSYAQSLLERYRG
jgi:hypothetical protein